MQSVKLMPGSHYAIFVVKTSGVRLNDKDKNLATAHIIRLHATASLTLRDNSFPSVTSGHGDPGNGAVYKANSVDNYRSIDSIFSILLNCVS